MNNLHNYKFLYRPEDCLIWIFSQNPILMSMFLSKIIKKRALINPGFFWVELKLSPIISIPILKNLF